MMQYTKINSSEIIKNNRRLLVYYVHVRWRRWHFDVSLLKKYNPRPSSVPSSGPNQAQSERNVAVIPRADSKLERCV